MCCDIIGIIEVLSSVEVGFDKRTFVDLSLYIVAKGAATASLIGDRAAQDRPHLC